MQLQRGGVILVQLVLLAGACGGEFDGSGPSAPRPNVSRTNREMFGGVDGVGPATVALSGLRASSTDTICTGAIFQVFPEKGLACAVTAGHCDNVEFNSEAVRVQGFAAKVSGGGWTHKGRSGSMLPGCNQWVDGGCDLAVTVIQVPRGFSGVAPLATTLPVIDPRRRAPYIWDSMKGSNQLIDNPSVTNVPRHCYADVLWRASGNVSYVAAGRGGYEDTPGSLDNCGNFTNANDSGSILFERVNTTSGVERGAIIGVVSGNRNDPRDPNEFRITAVAPKRDELLAQCEQLVWGGFKRPSTTWAPNTITQPLTPTGDVNGDCVVSQLDVTIVEQSLGCTRPNCASYGANGNCLNSGGTAIFACQGDVDGDWDTDNDDRALVDSHLGAKCTVDGDVNRDGIVGGSDEEIVQRTMGCVQSICTPHHATANSCLDTAGFAITGCRGDADGDGRTTARDLAVVRYRRNPVSHCTTPGDVNHDCRVDTADMQLMRNNFGCNSWGTVGLTAVPANLARCAGDIDGDGSTSGSDFLALQRDIGRSCPARNAAGIVTALHNPTFPEDVNQDGHLTPNDFHLIENALAADSDGVISTASLSASALMDVNADGSITGADASQVIAMIQAVGPSRPPASCDGVPDGQDQSRTRYVSDHVAVGASCVGETQTRRCTDGSWSEWTGRPEYRFGNCFPDRPLGSRRWLFSTGSPINSSPAVGADGTVYVGNNAGYLFAIDPATGAKKWHFPNPSQPLAVNSPLLAIRSSPAISSDGTIYFGADDGKLYAVDSATGTLRWNFTTGGAIRSSPAIATDGTIYVGSTDYKVYAIRSDGSLQWAYTTGAAVTSSPVIDRSGVIYISSLDYYVYAINPNGSPRWFFNTSNDMESAPAIGSDGTIYISSFVIHQVTSTRSSIHSKFCALRPDGTAKWCKGRGESSQGYFYSPPAISADGIIYLGIAEHSLDSEGFSVYTKKFAAYNPDGSKRSWSDPGLHVESTPMITSDGIVYVINSNGDQRLRALNPYTAAEWWTYPLNTTGDRVSSSPSVGPDGTVYVADNGGNLHAVYGRAPLANAPWAKFRGGATNTGRAP